MFKRLRQLENDVFSLKKILPRFYNLLLKEYSAYPCDEFKKVLCNQCDNCMCIYHTSNTKDQTAEKIMEEFVKMGDHHRQI